MIPCPDDLPLVADPQASNLPGWFLLGLLVGIAVAEVILMATGRPTISQWLARRTRGRKWLKFLGAGLIGTLLWHLFQGGPL